MLGRTGRVLALVFTLAFRLARAAPVTQGLLEPIVGVLEEPGDEPQSEVLVRAVVSVCLVLLGGVFAGLTIGLMGQDEVYLQVTVETGESSERKHAEKVLKLLSKGKHWVLVTLLLSNVITNETLPIVLDRLLGGGWPAIVSSTAAIVVFGEIIPQSICVRYGLPLGAAFAPFVKFLMYAMYPLAVPIANLLDYTLGEDHGTVYKKAGLKSFVTLHHHMGIERLNEDEVTIISAVLDLKDKPVSQIMTPINDVFVLSSDEILDEAMVERILLTGFNRIPIHVPGQPLNFSGMLLVRTLITYDPDDALPVSAFALATLPETSPDTSCLNILNYFQEGKSHMVAVSEDPGAVSGAVGVVTLEDVIEELIGEEIVDESDVYVDVHRAIRRVTPSPMLKSRRKTEDPDHPDNHARLRPINPANAPKPTHNAKITIKRGPQPQHYGQRSDGQAVVVDERPDSRPESRPDPSAEPRDSRLGEGPTNSEAFLSRALVPDQEQSGPELSPPALTRSDSLSQLAKSPGNIVTKVPGDVKVSRTENQAMQHNLGKHGVTKTSKSSQTNSIEPYRDDPNDDDEGRATFSENVVNVNGVHKVVIKDFSSEDDSDEARRSQSGQ